MNINKLSIGAFIPKKGFKTIHVKNPNDKTVETFLTLASRRQRQEAMELQLVKTVEKQTLPSRFKPGYFEALKSQNIGSHDTGAILKTPILGEDILGK